MKTVMAIVPSLRAGPLGEMVDGELIRFRLGRRMVLGMVAGCDFVQIASGKVIVVLEDHPDRPGIVGRFLPIEEFMMSEPALSYGTAHMIAVHPGAPVAAASDEQFNTDGALLVGADTRAIRTRAMRDEFSDVVLTIDLESWKAVRTAPPNRPPWRVAVLAWEIRLLTDASINPPLPSVFTFRAGS
jgi:hypothetical protein